MNVMTNIKNITRLSEKELHRGSTKSWHDMYKDSAWIFVGGIPYELTEGDVICIFSQFGEVVDLNFVREKPTGKPKGFGFLCYEDQRSTVLAVDNMNGVKILNRTLRVDHVADYQPPRDAERRDRDYSPRRDRDGPGSPRRNRGHSPRRQRDFSARRDRKFSPRRERNFSPRRDRDFSPPRKHRDTSPRRPPRRDRDRHH